MMGTLCCLVILLSSLWSRQIMIVVSGSIYSHTAWSVKVVNTFWIAWKVHLLPPPCVHGFCFLWWLWWSIYTLGYWLLMIGFTLFYTLGVFCLKLSSSHLIFIEFLESLKKFQVLNLITHLWPPTKSIISKCQWIYKSLSFKRFPYGIL